MTWIEKHESYSVFICPLYRNALLPLRSSNGDPGSNPPWPTEIRFRMSFRVNRDRPNSVFTSIGELDGKIGLGLIDR